MVVLFVNKEDDYNKIGGWLNDNTNFTLLGIVHEWISIELVFEMERTN